MGGVRKYIVTLAYTNADNEEIFYDKIMSATGGCDIKRVGLSACRSEHPDETGHRVVTSLAY